MLHQHLLKFNNLQPFQVQSLWKLLWNQVHNEVSAHINIVKFPLHPKLLYIISDTTRSCNTVRKLGKTKVWLAMVSLTASPFSRSFVKEEHLLCLNYTCDYVPSGPLTCTNAKHGNSRKDGAEDKWGLQSSSNCNNLAESIPPPASVPWPHSLRNSQLTSLPRLIPTEARVTQDSPPSSVHLLPTAPCPSSYSYYNCPQGLKHGSHCECQETQTQSARGPQHKDFSFLSLRGSSRS